MDRIEDERVAFYLKHQDLIETWAAVRSDVASAAHAFHLSLASDLEERAPGLGQDVRVWVDEDRYSHVGLYREPWYRATGPLIAAAFEWDSKATFSDGSRVVGVVTFGSDQAVEALRPHVSTEVGAIRKQAGYDRSSSWWPAYRAAPSPGPEAYWADLSQLRAALVEAVVEAWTTFHDTADRAFEAWISASAEHGGGVA